MWMTHRTCNDCIQLECAREIKRAIVVQMCVCKCLNASTRAMHFYSFSPIFSRNFPLPSINAAVSVCTACVCECVFSFTCMHLNRRHACCISRAFDSLQQSAIDIVQQFSYIIQLISVPRLKLHKIIFLMTVVFSLPLSRNFAIDVILIITQSEPLLAATIKWNQWTGLRMFVLDLYARTQALESIW